MKYALVAMALVSLMACGTAPSTTVVVNGVESECTPIAEDTPTPDPSPAVSPTPGFLDQCLEKVNGACILKHKKVHKNCIKRYTKVCLALAKS